ncbi:hypothetical protein KRP22_013310 [Phytophthora ramorum]|uniref:uncharacterized protein n=1 Tax=Phytophthora ramorum TaxID=164328 RepID=UPI0030A6241F|nr:hypothetical protein KRP23_11736 [Phytophthora ramorum]KAH7499410.1 hypothetical protein KRP22_10899 [Phytophthora ramorum]
MPRVMKYLPAFLVVVLAMRTCFCVSTKAGSGQEVREVFLNSADGGVIQISGENDKQKTPQQETPWSKARSGLVRQQFGLLSQDPTQNATSSSPIGSSTFLPERWTDILDSNWLNEFLMHCEQDPVFKAGVAQNLSAMQAFVAFVSIGYAVVAMWLGPIQLTCWQRRSILVTYSAAGLVQAIFLTHSFGFVDVHFAYPATLALALLFFISFNVTNALLVLQSEETQAEATHLTQQIIQASSTRVITSLCAPCC